MNMLKIVRALTFFFTIAVIFFNGSTVSAKDDSWDEWVEKFFRPLTYDNFDPNDFGKEVSEEDKAILERFKPVIYLAPDGITPINFYDDYLPKVKIINKSKKGAPVSATRSFLKSVERDKNYTLEFSGSYSEFKSNENVGYGQVIRESVEFRADGGKNIEIPLTFLRYNFVFIKSGLPKKLGWIKEIGASLIGDPDLWHPLDIHGAIHVVLMGELPVAVILAQHNYHRTYLFDDLSLAGEKVEISFAQRSNEPYPAPRGTKPSEHYAADTPEKILYILTGKKSNLKTGIDVVYGENSGGRKVEYILKFLPDKDPLYTSWIPLGERMKFLNLFDSWYRSAPPGMDLRTWPELKRYGELMQFWFIKDNDNEEAEFMAENIIDFFTVNFEKIIRRNGARLFAALGEKLKTSNNIAGRASTNKSN